MPRLTYKHKSRNVVLVVDVVTVLLVLVVEVEVVLLVDVVLDVEDVLVVLEVLDVLVVITLSRRQKLAKSIPGLGPEPENANPMRTCCPA